MALAGSWIYRSFNPEYVSPRDQPLHPLIFAEANLTLRTGIDPVAWDALEGTIEWEGGGLNLSGTVKWGEGKIYDVAAFDIVGTGRPDSTGRPGTGTDGWEYAYQGHLTWPWTGAVNQVPTLVGSVFRVRDHNGQPGSWRSPRGYVGSFIAVKRQPDRAFALAGSWAYRSFHNETAPQTAPGLILQEAVFRLRTPTDTTLQGTIELPGRGVLDIDLTGGEVRLAEVPPEFTFRGVGRRGTQTDGWEYLYHGHLTQNWQGAVNQRPALVGSVFRLKAHGDSPALYVYPFIAVKQ